MNEDNKNYKVYKNHQVFKDNLTRSQAIMILDRAYRKAHEDGDKSAMAWGNGLNFNVVTLNDMYRIEEQK